MTEPIIQNVERNNNSGIKNAVIGFFVCILFLAGIGGGYYFGHQKGNSEGFSLGYDTGKTIADVPTTEETEAENRRLNAANDLVTISQKYQELSDLCEQKYQVGLKGDMYTAMSIKGKMEAIQTQINEIYTKYNDSNNTDAPNATFQ